MFSKKSQSEIITTVLIILLVLAAIVIVWQVVNNTVSKAGNTVTSQSNCIGVSLSVTKVATKVYSIQRTGGGTLSTAPLGVDVIADGVTAICTWNPATPAWINDGTTATCTLANAPTTSVVADLRLSDGTVCSVSTNGGP